jgi:HK97 family phage prohead protease
VNRKSLPGRAMVKDAAQGIAELVVSAYGNVDHDKDLVVKGAVAKQIAGEYGPNPKGLLDHDWSMRSAVAKTLRMWEDDEGLHVEAQYNLAKQVGREAFDDLTFYGEDMEFSVGYEIKARRAPTEGEKALGAKQVITEWQINEWSHVMLGANSATRLVAAKARKGDARITIDGETYALVRVVGDARDPEPAEDPAEPKQPPAEQPEQPSSVTAPEPTPVVAAINPESVRAFTDLLISR